MHRWTEGDILTNGTRLHYYRTGGLKPSLVLAHGITDDGLCWNPVARALSGGYDVIMVDLRAHGKSDAPDQGYSYETMATELAGLISGLGLGKPVLLGHSMGAVTVLVLAALFPNLPGAILLEDPPNTWDAGDETPEMLEHRRGMVSWMRQTKELTRDELLAGVRQTHPTWSDAELEPWADAKERFDLKIINMVNNPQNSPSNIADLFPRITCPALLITADPKLDAALHARDIDSLKALVPQLIHEHIPRAGHNIRRDQFSQYLDVVGKFLSTLSSG